MIIYSADLNLRVIFYKHTTVRTVLLSIPLYVAARLGFETKQAPGERTPPEEIGE
jgi:hypothetical protein